MNNEKLIHLSRAIAKVWVLDIGNPQHRGKKQPRANTDMEDKIIINNKTYHSILPTVMLIGLSDVYCIPKEDVMDLLLIEEKEYKYKMSVFISIMKNIQTRIKRLEGDYKRIRDAGIRRWVIKYKSITEIIMKQKIKKWVNY